MGRVKKDWEEKGDLNEDSEQTWWRQQDEDEEWLERWDREKMEKQEGDND